MSYPVTDFTNLDLWYIYNGILESGGGGGGGMTESEFYAIINGTSPLGTPDSLFETISGNNIPLSNLLYTIYQTLQGSATETTLQSIDSKVATATNQTTANTSLSSIDTKLTNVATTTLQTTGNASLSNIETNTGAQRTANLISSNTTGTIAPQIHNVSFYNAGSSAGTITVSNGSAISIPAGVSINFNAGGNNNRYSVNTFAYNATGTTFIIGYTQ